jgi:hypothetical protein
MYRSRIASQGIVRIVATALTLAAIAAGCGDGKPKFDTFPAATSIAAAPVPATNLPTTTPPAATTAAVAGTSAPAETTVLPAATTTLEQSAIEGFGLLQVSGGECVQFPVTCDLSATALGGSAFYESVRSFLDERIADGVAAHRVPELDYWNVESVQLGVDQKSAKVRYCEVDGYWLYDVNSTWDDQSDDILIDDTLNSWRWEKTIVLTANGWRTTEILNLDEWPGENRCGVKL